VTALDSATALNKIREFEALVGVRANFQFPVNNLGNVMDWVLIVNRARLSNERPIELDDYMWTTVGENRRDTVLADRAAQIAQNADDEAGK